MGGHVSTYGVHREAKVDTPDIKHFNVKVLLLQAEPREKRPNRRIEPDGMAARKVSLADAGDWLVPRIMHHLTGIFEREGDRGENLEGATSGVTRFSQAGLASHPGPDRRRTIQTTRRKSCK
jgi:hypothetical protein